MRTAIVSPLKETAQGATAEAVLRACVHCGMCNAACPTYRLTGDELDGPRGRIWLIKQALEGEAVSGLSLEHLDRCLSCRACETACPSGVEYHRLLDVGRGEVARRAARPISQRLARAALRWLALRPSVLAMVFALARRVGLAPAVPDARPAPKITHPRRVIALGGCVQAAAAPHFNAALARVFDAAGIGLEIRPGCCGALSFHLGAEEEARSLARAHIDAMDGAEAITTCASGCAAFIRDWPDLLLADRAYAEKARAAGARLVDPVEVLAANPPRVSRAPTRRRIAVHDPCTLINGPGLGGAVARLLTGLGYEPVAPADGGACCGSAGAYSLFQPAFARRLRAERIAALSADAPDAIVTANIGCWLHLAPVSPAPVRHWIEAIDDLISRP